MGINVFLREAEQLAAGEHNGHVNLLLIKTRLRDHLLLDLGKTLPRVYTLWTWQSDIVICKVHTQELYN